MSVDHNQIPAPRHLLRKEIHPSTGARRKIIISIKFPAHFRRFSIPWHFFTTILYSLDPNLKKYYLAFIGKCYPLHVRIKNRLAQLRIPFPRRAKYDTRHIFLSPLGGLDYSL